MNYETYSQIGQDIFVNNILNEKTNGLFLDVGCCRPEHINNTFLFEKNYNWDGISIDIDDYSKEWQEKRITKFICQDALTVDYQTIISDLLTRNKKDRIENYPILPKRVFFFGRCDEIFFAKVEIFFLSMQEKELFPSTNDYNDDDDDDDDDDIGGR